MAKGLPEAFGQQHIRPVEEYPRRLLSALRKTAPSGVDDPTVVVLTPVCSTAPTSNTRYWPG
ncbi:glutamate-Cysteine ligase [Arthrobacter sp. Hiyo8]|nr:glutamate-Cysteine ligase [Arthrobacter sp. Hiyo8]